MASHPLPASAVHRHDHAHDHAHHDHKHGASSASVHALRDPVSSRPTLMALSAFQRLLLVLPLTLLLWGLVLWALQEV